MLIYACRVDASKSIVFRNSEELAPTVTYGTTELAPVDLVLDPQRGFDQGLGRQFS